MSAAVTIAAALRAQADALELQARTLRAQADALDAGAVAATPAHPHYADATNNPYGSARAFADAARRNDFPTFRRGRRVAAKWADVEAAIEARRCARRAPAPPVAEIDEDEAILAANGITLRASNDATPCRAGKRGAR